METGFASRYEEIRQNCRSLDCCLKVQVSDFALFPYFGANGLTIFRFLTFQTSLAIGTRSFYEMVLPSTRGAKIRSIPGPSSIFWPSFNIDVCNKHSDKKEQMYIGREDEKNIFSCADFTRLCNFIRNFPEFSLGIFNNDITFPLLSISRACKRRKIVLTCLEKHMKQIYTRRYSNCTITDTYCCQGCPFQRAINMWIICDSIFGRQHNQIRKILIPLCKKSTYRYHLNILRIVSIVYHIYIECELYNLAYTRIWMWYMKMNSYVQQWVSGMIMIHLQNNLFTEVLIICRIIIKWIISSFVNIYCTKQKIYMIIINSKFH